ncbi:MAG TPA: methyltransferase domain-containing protein [Solirubrobacteraceae bacterium]|nr:methyltransferase domain-containing protein [Solirubrobacteraceae bacterium]
MDAPAGNRCPLCGGASQLAFVTRDRNRAIGDERFEYRRCEACRSLYLRNVPADLGRFYPSEYFGRPSIDELRALARGSEAYRAEVLRRHAGGGRLAEIGPGDGIFTVQALDAGFEVSAIEMDAAACAHLRAMLGIEVVESAAPQDALRTLTPLRAVAAWHVLEHLPDPWALVDAAADALEPGGVLIVATPNPAAFGLRVLGGRWPHVDAPRHLFLIPHETLAAHARGVGLEPVELTHADPGGRRWNTFGWHYALRRPGISPLADHAALLAGRAIAAALAPVERRGMRGAAYTMVLRRRS